MPSLNQSGVDVSTATPTTQAHGDSAVVGTDGNAADAAHKHGMPAAGGGISNVVEDTTPQLGGNLDMQARLLVGNGGSTGIAISANGEVNMAAQPAFLAVSPGETNVTGNSTVATLSFSTEIFDQNADFSSPTFTASVTGRYRLSAMVRVGGVTAAADTIDIRITTSNRTTNIVWQNTNLLPTAFNLVISTLTDMDAADTATVAVIVAGEASDVVDIEANENTQFAGELVA